MAEIVEIPLDQPEPAQEEAPEPQGEEPPEPPEPRQPSPSEPARQKARPKGRPKGSLNKPKPAARAPPPPHTPDENELPPYVQQHLPAPRDPMSTLLDALLQSDRARREQRTAKYAQWVGSF